jgi:hypothetical protein
VAQGFSYYIPAFITTAFVHRMEYAGSRIPSHLRHTGPMPWSASELAIDITSELSSNWAAWMIARLKPRRGHANMYTMGNAVKCFSSTKPLPWQSTPLYFILLDQDVVDESLWCSEQRTRCRHC